MSTFITETGEEYVYDNTNEFDSLENAEYVLICSKNVSNGEKETITSFFKNMNNFKIYNREDYTNSINGDINNIENFDLVLKLLIPVLTDDEDEYISFCGNSGMNPNYILNSIETDNNFILYRKIKYSAGFMQSKKLLHSIITFEINPNNIYVDSLCVNNINKLKGAGILLNLLVDLSVVLHLFSFKTPILLGKKIRKNVKSIVGISPTMVLLFHLPFVYLKM